MKVRNKVKAKMANTFKKIIKKHSGKHYVFILLVTKNLQNLK